MERLFQQALETIRRLDEIAKEQAKLDAVRPGRLSSAHHVPSPPHFEDVIYDTLDVEVELDDICC